MINTKTLKEAKNIHCIGIGGIGLSAIAKMLLTEGKSVSGSNLDESLVTEKLRKDGAEIFIGHDKKYITEDTELVIYTIAINDDNPELLEAKKLGIPTITYPEALGLLTEEKYTVAVAGTHGKTTTTAMCAEILIHAGKSPTVIVGSFLNKEKENFISGDSNLLVVEACEYRESFLNLSPDIAVLTNIDNDHLDYFGDLEMIKKAFRKFVERVPVDGYVVYDPEDPNSAEVVKGLECNMVKSTELALELALEQPGEFNIKNAKSAGSVAKILGVSDEDIASSLEAFKGTWRRQEFKGKTKEGALIYDDYAHHPTEIKAVIKGFKEKFKDKKISVVFQPHLYSRTKLLMNDFVDALLVADGIIITDIYAAREKKDDSVNSEMLVNKINKHGEKAIYTKTFEEITEKLSQWAGENDVVITVGAGSIFEVGELLLN